MTSFADGRNLILFSFNDGEQTTLNLTFFVCMMRQIFLICQYPKFRYEEIMWTIDPVQMALNQQNVSCRGILTLVSVLIIDGNWKTPKKIRIVWKIVFPSKTFRKQLKNPAIYSSRKILWYIWSKLMVIWETMRENWEHIAGHIEEHGKTSLQCLFLRSGA